MMQSRHQIRGDKLCYRLWWNWKFHLSEYQTSAKTYQLYEDISNMIAKIMPCISAHQCQLDKSQPWKHWWQKKSMHKNLFTSFRTIYNGTSLSIRIAGFMVQNKSQVRNCAALIMTNSSRLSKRSRISFAFQDFWRDNLSQNKGIKILGIPRLKF